LCQRNPKAGRDEYATKEDRNEWEVFPFIKEFRHIVEYVEIIIGRNKKQVAKFNCYRLSKRKLSSLKDHDPEEIEEGPGTDFYYQISLH
jgi:hypothetical protein